MNVSAEPDFKVGSFTITAAGFKRWKVYAACRDMVYYTYGTLEEVCTYLREVESNLGKRPDRRLMGWG